MFAKLTQLAQKPFDLAAPNALTPERILKYQSEACGYKVLYGTERITDEVITTLNELATQAKAIEKMKQMQAGAILNTTENRMVLHTATRDFFENPNKNENAKEAAAKARAEVDRLDTFMKKIDAENEYIDLVQIGIGGSNLGPEACYIALEYLKKTRRNIHFLSNIDSDNAAEVLRKVNLERTLFVLVSKSGTTSETLVNEELIKAQLEKHGLKPRKHIVTVTGQGSPLDDKRKYLECFYIWDWIGGRYSATSMVGAVVLSFAFGFEQYWEFLRGANTMDKAVLHQELNRNPALLLALLGIWNRNFLNYPTLAIIPYSHALRRFTAHLQQLDMESNGKYNTQHKTGPIIWGEPGTNAQHSFFQLIHQGTDIVPIEFIGFKLCQEGKDYPWDGTTSQEKLLANMFAQAIALATGEGKDFHGNRPSHIILGRKLNPSSLGTLLALIEHKVAFQGFIWNINSFDQPGVQLGKVLAERVIAQFAMKHGIHKGSEYPLAKAFIETLEIL